MNHPTKALRAAAAIVAVAALCSLSTADSIRFLADTYLESDGSQAIDTGIRPTTNMTVEVEFSPLAAPGTTWLFGSISDASSMAYGVYLQGSTVHFAGGAHGGTINYWDTSVKTTASRFKSVYNFATRRVYLYSGDTELFSGWGVQIAAPAVATNELTLALFCHHGYQTTYSDRFTGRIYSCRIREGGTLLRDMVPYGSGIVTGLLDRVTGKVFGDVRNGNPFIIGTDGGFVRSDLNRNSGQFVDTGWRMTPATKIEIDFAMSALGSTHQVVFGTTKGSGLPCGFAVNGQKKWTWFFQDGDSYSWIDTGIVADTARHTFTLDGPNSTATLAAPDGTVQYSAAIVTTRSNTATIPLPLFGNASTNGTGVATFGSPSSVRIHRCRIWDGATLVRDFLPRVSGNREGLYDSVNSKMYYPALSYTSATGNYRLTAGGDVTCDAATGVDKGDSDAYAETANNASFVSNYTLTRDSKLEIDFAMMAFSGTQYLFSDGKYALYFQQNTSYGERNLACNWVGSNGSSSWPLLQWKNFDSYRYRVSFDFRNGSAADKGTQIARFGSTTSTYNWSLPTPLPSSASLKFCRDSSGGSIPRARIYSVKLYTWDDATGDFALRHHCVPCAQGGVGGFWDVETETFVKSSTAANFTVCGAGADGSGMVFTQQPQDCSLNRDETATLSAFAPGAVSYRWFKDGELVEGETGRTLQVAYGRAGTSATYRCEATYALFGTAISSEAVVQSVPGAFVIAVR